MIRAFFVILAVAIAIYMPRIGLAGVAEVATFSEIAPILNKHCVTCHAGEKPPHGLRLDSYDNVMKGAGKGPAVIPQDSANSEIIKRVTGQSKPAMPPKDRSKLSKEDIQNIRTWIDAGATR